MIYDTRETTDAKCVKCGGLDFPNMYRCTCCKKIFCDNCGAGHRRDRYFNCKAISDLKKLPIKDEEEFHFERMLVLKL